MSEAHLASHGETEEKYEHEFILKANVMPPPKLRTMRDRYGDLVKKSRVVVKQSLAERGIDEVYGGAGEDA